MNVRLPRVRRTLFALVAALASSAAPLASVQAQSAPAAPPSPAPAASPSDAAPAVAPANAPSVVSVSVSGNAHVPTDKILSVVRTKAGEPFDERTVREDLQNIFDLGYFEDQVPPLIRQRPDGVAITFRVIENPVVERISFAGNDHVPSDTLLALMDTAVGQVFNTNTFHQDIIKINSYYDKVGYGGQVGSHITGLNISKDGVLALSIREGLTVRNILIKPGGADTVLNADLIKKAISLKEGQPYSDDSRDKDFQAIKALYDRYNLNVGDFEAGIDPTSVDLKAGTADVVYTVYAMRVGAVQVTGNTVTKDQVVRRQLRVKPGTIVTQSGLKRDYERLNNLGFFEKVDLNTKPGPNPKKPYEVTLDWNVKEQRTGTAQVGAGYSGGQNGQGLTGTLSYSQNNIGGSGNGAQIRLERGSRVSDASLSYTVPYLGNSPRAQRYSLAASVFTSNQTNFYQVYQGSTATVTNGSNFMIGPPAPTVANASGSGTIPVTLAPNSNIISGTAANYVSRSTGLSTTIGRRLSDYATASVGVTAQRLATSVTVPFPYFVPGTQNIFNGISNNNPFGQNNTGSTIGIAATSIKDTANGSGFNLRSATLGLSTDSQDDVFAPRTGAKGSLSEEFSTKGFGSDFNYTILTLDGAKFYPVGKLATLGFHAQIVSTTGAIPTSKLTVYSDQQLRGYSQVFYGTEARLLQAELRVPLTPARNFGVAFFGDYGALRIRGAQLIQDQFANTVANYNQYIYHGDVGAGLRFDLPQLGFRSIRLDIAHGKGGNHTSFGIGQSF